MLINMTVVIISQCTHILIITLYTLKNHVVQAKYIYIIFIGHSSFNTAG